MMSCTRPDAALRMLAYVSEQQLRTEHSLHAIALAGPPVRSVVPRATTDGPASAMTTDQVPSWAIIPPDWCPADVALFPASCIAATLSSPPAMAASPAPVPTASRAAISMLQRAGEMLERGGGRDQRRATHRGRPCARAPAGTIGPPGRLRKYACSLCGGKYLRLNHLSRHVSAVHLGVRHPCNRCPAEFSDAYDLRKHLRARHPHAA